MCEVQCSRPSKEGHDTCLGLECIYECLGAKVQPRCAGGRRRQREAEGGVAHTCISGVSVLLRRASAMASCLLRACAHGVAQGTCAVCHDRA